MICASHQNFNIMQCWHSGPLTLKNSPKHYLPISTTMSQFEGNLATKTTYYKSHCIRTRSNTIFFKKRLLCPNLKETSQLKQLKLHCKKHNCFLCSNGKKLYVLFRLDLRGGRRGRGKQSMVKGTVSKHAQTPSKKNAPRAF